MKTPKEILVRLPNWLGDMVMAYPFLDSLRRAYPAANITIIAKQGLESLVPYLGHFNKIIPFSKKEFPGLKGVYRFGKSLQKATTYDLFISLPDSFSAAVMGYATGARHRVGYRKELRQWMLTHPTNFPPAGTHRSEVYRNLLLYYCPTAQISKVDFLEIEAPEKVFPLPVGKHLIFNVNSNADSRRLPIFKALEFIEFWMKTTNYHLILPGHHTEFDYVEHIAKLAGHSDRIFNLAGKTTIPELMAVLQQADQLITTDTGIAHLGNAMGTHTVMLLGAADERVTAPIFTERLRMPRVPDLACAPCVRNTCKVGGVPCLTGMEVDRLLNPLEG